MMNFTGNIYKWLAATSTLLFVFNDFVCCNSTQPRTCLPELKQVYVDHLSTYMNCTRFCPHNLNDPRCKNECCLTQGNNSDGPTPTCKPQIIIQKEYVNVPLSSDSYSAGTLWTVAALLMISVIGNIVQSCLLYRQKKTKQKNQAVPSTPSTSGSEVSISMERGQIGTEDEPARLGGIFSPSLPATSTPSISKV